MHLLHLYLVCSDAHLEGLAHTLARQHSHNHIGKFVEQIAEERKQTDLQVRVFERTNEREHIRDMDS